MVSNSRTPTRGARTGDRAQLILIAAIALAFIILSIVVVFNSVLYTQTMSSSSSIETTSDAQLAELELKRGIRGVAQEANQRSTNATYETNVEDNISSFAETYQFARSESGPVIVNVSSISVAQTGMLVNGTVDTSDTTILEDESRIVGHVRVLSEGVSVNVSHDGEHTIINGTETEIFNASYENVTVSTTSGSTEVEISLKGTDGTSSSSLYNQNVAWSVNVVTTYDTAELTYDRQSEIFIYGGKR